MVATALNEQGFMFAQLVRENIQFGTSGLGDVTKTWRCVASEYPVTANDGSQTRIDLVLRSIRSRELYACIECKRAHPAYKQWIFFDKEYGTQSPRNSYFEKFVVSQRPMRDKNDAHHVLDQRQMPISCELFKMYLEVALSRDKRAGYTETIEDAFLQSVKGQTGLMAKQIKTDDVMRLRVVPVVVTTAQLFEARFDLQSVSVATGMIAPEHLKLVPLEFCAVNYHPNDNLASRSEYMPRVSAEVDIDLRLFHTRTVFVVQSESLIKFLHWLHDHVADCH